MMGGASILWMAGLTAYVMMGHQQLESDADAPEDAGRRQEVQA
jgi:hypothetical protein